MISAQTAVVHLLFVTLASLAVSVFVEVQQIDRVNFVWIIYIHVLTSNIALELAAGHGGPAKSPRARPPLTLIDLLLLVFTEFAACGGLVLLTARLDASSRG
jgi:hypothetical protein